MWGTKFGELEGWLPRQLTGMTQQKLWNEEPELNAYGREQKRDEGAGAE